MSPPPSAATPQAVLLAVLAAACGVWAAILAVQSRRGDRQSRRAPQPGQQWRIASAACVGTALAGQMAGVLLRARLADASRGGDSLSEALSCLVCLLLLVLHWSWRSNQRLWLLAAPVSAGAALSLGALVEAAQAYQHPTHQQGADATWVACHYETAALALAVLDACAMAAAACCLLAAAAASGDSGDSQQQPLLQEEGRKRRRIRGGSKRMRLIQGTFNYLVPDTINLKIRLLACFALLLVGRVVNIALPLAYKRVIDRLAETGTAAASAAMAAAAGDASTAASGGGGGVAGLQALCATLAARAVPTFRDVFLPWVAVYLGLTFLQGGSGKGGIGLLSNLRDLLWIPLQQRACRRVSMDVFGHLLRLDHSFHLHRNTGKVMRILDRGTSSIQDVMAVVLFNVLPQLIDVVSACAYMALKLQPWTAIVVMVTVVTYIPITFVITEYRGKVRKTMNKLDNEKEGKATDMLLNYETVKLFTNERFELAQYGRSIDAFQGHEYLQLACISLLNIAQSALVFVGLAMGLVVCVRGIVAGTNTVGDAVLFLALMGQLVAPLSFFGSYYRQIQKGLIDMENMFDLLDTRPAVDDAPGASQLAVTRGDVAFERVTFSYTTGAPVLRNISFAIEGGKTLALVGATGSGKSTVLRLLLRFYDPVAGRVLLDGCDVAACTLASVRSRIAVVPQDTVLFNDTIRYNIRYGRTNATDEEVEEATRVAHIHDAIINRFPEGYHTVVGERGLRLSGGEKQRVAFARAVLRRPAILVLDEATSALDTLTERMIQESLAGMRQQCTTIIVAHRLSTIADANQILVFDGGSIAEAGTHGELLARGGLYATMWQRQQEGTTQPGGFSQQAELLPPPLLSDAAPATATGATTSGGTAGGAAAAAAVVVGSAAGGQAGAAAAPALLGGDGGSRVAASHRPDIGQEIGEAEEDEKEEEDRGWRQRASRQLGLSHQDSMCDSEAE